MDLPDPTAVTRRRAVGRAHDGVPHLIVGSCVNSTVVVRATCGRVTACGCIVELTIASIGVAHGGVVSDDRDKVQSLPTTGPIWQEICVYLCNYGDIAVVNVV